MAVQIENVLGTLVNLKRHEMRFSPTPTGDNPFAALYLHAERELRKIKTRPDRSGRAPIQEVIRIVAPELSSIHSLRITNLYPDLSNHELHIELRKALKKLGYEGALEYFERLEEAKLQRRKN